ncbi:DUF5988 family protein [Dactylosporangium sp. NPDC048998]|uniref:DUF5988 family protein n=1 Tax=Dactylosporangium sp. NPDC048998 TaxID=3363976 RepID=UPI00371A5184
MTEQMHMNVPDQSDRVVRLEGGPRDFPEELRVHPEPAAGEKIKIEHHGGYEHFERTDESIELDGGPGTVFRWTQRTRIAE